MTFGGAFVSDIDPDATGTGSMFDDMDRTTADYDLGSSTPTGVPYQLNVDGGVFYGVFQYTSGIPSNLPADVKGTMFFSRDPSAPGLGHGVIYHVPSAGQPWASPTGFVMTGLFDTYNAPGSVLNNLIRLALDGGGELRLDTNSLTGTVRVDGVQVAKTDWLAGNDGFRYWFKWERVPGGVSRAKVWLTQDAEPVDWLVTATALPSSGGAFLELRVDVPDSRFDGDNDAVNIYRIDFSETSVPPDEFESIATGFGG